MLKSIFEFFHKYNVDANTVSTLVITIFVFGLGVIISWVGSVIKSKKTKRAFRSSIIFVLENFRAACLKQVSVVTLSLETVGLQYNKDFNVTLVPIGTLDYLNRMDLSTLINNLGNRNFFICKSNRPKAISKLIELVAQTKLQHDQVSKIMQIYSQAYQKHEKNFNENLDLLRKISDQFFFQ